jgi:carotenoid cleavage dioxygenase-like enzyme
LVILLGTSVVLSRIGLYITLRPIELLFDWLLWVEPGKHWALKGNFAPIDKELSFEIEASMIKEGAIPNDVNGVYLRNGPNPTWLPPHNRYHWFDGDGHIHGLRIKNGRAYYCNRQTLSNSFKEHRDLQRQTHVYLGAFNGMAGLL